MLRRPIKKGCKDAFRRTYYTPTLSKTLLDALDQKDKLTDIKDVAILGGGITGLASAYFTSLRWPKAKVTLFEGSSRVGGWMRSDSFDVNNGKVIFEQGPRSLRPAKGTLALIVALGLEKDLILTSKESPAAKNRFIYHQDRLVLLKPTLSISEIMATPLLKMVMSELIGTFFKQSRPVSVFDDESVGDFFRRRGCPGMANDLVSAVLHGIYAGDVDELSCSAILPSLTKSEAYYGSPFGYFTKRFMSNLGIGSLLKFHDLYKVGMDDFYAYDILEKVERKDEYLNSSIYTLRGGLQRLSDELVRNLRSNPQVKIITETFVKQIGGTAGDGKSTRASVAVSRRGNDKEAVRSYDRIISTLPATSLAKICPPLQETLGTGTASTVAVVNLFYAQPNLSPIQGFGYLIPKSTPRANNPEGALGVVFDTDATPQMDSAEGTKLTVMLGGPFWKGVQPEQLPSKDEAIEMAKGVLASHLGITDEPLLAQANIQANCIPQYTVGHLKRMADAEEIMRSGKEPWTHCVKVAGSSYNGVGVNDCIQSAFFASLYLPANQWFGSNSPHVVGA